MGRHKRSSAAELITTGAATTKSLTWSASEQMTSLASVFSYTGGGATVTQTDTTPEDGVLQTFNTSGVTGPITAASLGGKDILSLLSSTDPTIAITYTLDVSATESSIGMPRIGKDSTLSITTATDGAVTQAGIVIGVKTGWAVNDLAATLVKGVDDYLTLADSTLGITTAIGNQNYYKILYGESITPQGVYTGGTLVAYQFTDFVIQQGGSATTTATSEGGAFYPFGEAPSGGGGNNTSMGISSLKIGI
jgi:hypothetical protein